MDDNTTTPYGERIKNIRKRRGMSQKQLAAAGGVSLSWVKAQEQGNGGTPTTETMHKIAVALGVQTTHLIAMVRPGGPHRQTSEDWTEVRASLGEPAPGTGDATAEGVLEVLQAFQPALSANKYAAIRVMLPSLIRDARSLPEDPQGAQSRVLNLTAWLLTQTRQWDAAEAAGTAAKTAAAGDPLLAAAAVNTLCWSQLRQGHLTEALALARTEAEAMEPRYLSRATTRELALWGRLLLGVTNAAVRDNRAAEAEDALSLASAAAERISREVTADLSTTRTFGPVTVRMIAAENAAITRHPDTVLSISALIPPLALHPLSASRCRHRLDVANAYVMLRRYPDALEMLQQLHAEVPEWLVQQGYAREILRNITSQRRTLTKEIRDIADAINLPL